MTECVQLGESTKTNSVCFKCRRLIEPLVLGIYLLLYGDLVQMRDLVLPTAVCATKIITTTSMLSFLGFLYGQKSL